MTHRKHTYTHIFFLMCFLFICVCIQNISIYIPYVYYENICMNATCIESARKENVVRYTVAARLFNEQHQARLADKNLFENIQLC